MSIIDNSQQVQLLIKNAAVPQAKFFIYKGTMPKTPAVGKQDIKPFSVNQIQPGKTNSFDPVEITAQNLSDASIINTGANVFSNLDFSQSNIKFPVVLFNVTQNRNIITTPIQGYDNTVKEYISDGDFQITIDGIITGDRSYPKEAVQELIYLCKLKQALQVNSHYLTDIFGIFNIVITSYNLYQEEGRPYEQLFTINALSDAPVELFINP